MARFLITVWPFTGHIHPNMAIAYSLRKRGHEVAFYTGKTFQHLVEGEGFRFFPFQKVDEERVGRLVFSSEGIISRPMKPFRFKAMWRAWVFETVPMQISDLEGVMTSWPPDVIVCDPTMWGPFLVLHEARNVPVAVFSLIPACHLSGDDAPIFGFPLPRPRNGYERFRARFLRKVVNLFLADVRRDASSLRKIYGLSSLQCSVTDFAGQMPLYLVPGSPEFDYQRKDLPSSVHYVGPCLWNKPRREAIPAWLAQLPPEQPLVYVSEGTIQLEPRVLQAAAQGLANLPLQVIMTTGRHRDPDDLDLGARPLAGNIRVEQWVSLDDLLPYLDVMVTIGGPSTLMAALRLGIPVVIVPFDWDHPETAWRVQETGVGIRLAPRDCTPEGMREAVQRILSDPSFRGNAKCLAKIFAHRGGSEHAAALLEDLVVNVNSSVVRSHKQCLCGPEREGYG